jgi:hypothetical protein
MQRLASLVVLLGLAACGGPEVGKITCGLAGDAGPGAVTVTVGADSAQISGFRWGANNDCPAAGAQVISVTISGTQAPPAAAGFGIGMCLPRPDRIGAAPIDLGDDTMVQLAGASVSAGGCTLQKGKDAKPSGSLSFVGFCTETGSSYQVTFAGQVAGTKICGTGPTEEVVLQLAGTALVTPR